MALTEALPEIELDDDYFSAVAAAVSALLMSVPTRDHALACASCMGFALVAVFGVDDEEALDAFETGLDEGLAP